MGGITKDLPSGLFDAFSTEPRRYSSHGRVYRVSNILCFYSAMKQNDLSKFVVKKRRASKMQAIRIHHVSDLFPSMGPAIKKPMEDE